MKMIINGDDFGITHACNLAMEDCFRKGLMTSCSMMTNMPYAQEAAEIWRRNPDLSVGIHLNLSAGKPLTECSDLLKEDGTFDKDIVFGLRPGNTEQARKELQAQMDRFIELNGRLPDHINSHHGIERMPGGKELVFELARKYSRPIRRFLIEQKEYPIDFPVPEFPDETLNGKKGTNDALSEEQLIKELTEMKNEGIEYVEIPAHPGYVDEDLLKISSLVLGRVHDASLFMSEKLRSWMDENGVERISFRDLPALMGQSEMK